jgi:hypothetical protein
MPARRHVGLVGHLIAPVDGDEREREGGIADEPASGRPLDVVDEGFVQRPGVDAAFDRLDRAVVEAEGLRLQVTPAGVEPRLARAGKRLLGVGFARSPSMAVTKASASAAAAT